MLNQYYLETLARDRCSEAEEGVRRANLLRGVKPSRRVEVDLAQRVNGLQTRVGLEPADLGTRPAGRSSRGQYIEDCQGQSELGTVRQIVSIWAASRLHVLLVTLSGAKGLPGRRTGGGKGGDPSLRLRMTGT